MGFRRRASFCPRVSAGQWHETSTVYVSPRNMAEVALEAARSEAAEARASEAAAQEALGRALREAEAESAATSEREAVARQAVSETLSQARRRAPPLMAERRAGSLYILADL